MIEKYDIRKIYIGYVSKHIDIVKDEYDETISYYKYDTDDTKIGLFVRSLLGFKHILTGKTYKIASKFSLHKVVIERDRIFDFILYDKKMSRTILQQTKSYELTLEQIEQIEKGLNKYLITEVRQRKNNIKKL